MQKIRIEAWGAQGGGSLDCEHAIMVLQNDGGKGGYASGELNVMSGQLLYIVVGGEGKPGLNYRHDGGYNGGGDGGLFGAGGGGATDVRTILHDLDSRLIVAGGGGGGNTGFPDAGTGGNGGATIGQDGLALYVFTPGGGGGMQASGGTAGYAPGQPGSWGKGGNAGDGENQFHISGGGGGWFGGGSAYAAGGGGGSSNLWGVHDSTTIAGVRSGNGQVVITLLESNMCSTCVLSCHANVNVSMPSYECYNIISPDQVLSTVTESCTTFGYDLKISYPFGTNTLAGFDVDRSHLGRPLLYSVRDLNGNTCWGYLHIEDKSAPVTGCNGTRMVSCSQLNQLLDIKSQVIDNCSELNTAKIENLVFTDFGCNDFRGLGQISRTTLATDVWGNTSRCSDLIIISKDSIEETQCPDLISLNCKVTCRSSNVESSPSLSDYEEITFSKDPKDKYYPSPDLLLSLQIQDSIYSDQPCLPSYLNTVPYTYDSVLVWDEGEYIYQWQKVNLYKLNNVYCKIEVTYHDEIIPTCGNGFKIRRQWRIIDWCTSKEKTCIQYIEVLDKTGPALILPATGGLDLRDNRLFYRSSVDPHSCFATTHLKQLVIQDCSPGVVQKFRSTYSDPRNGSKLIVQEGTLPGIIKLPTEVVLGGKGRFGVRCHEISVMMTDGCYNTTDTTIQVCVVDDESPEVIANEFTIATVDPSTCWSRVYAKDLDKGSRDNCCNVLHFAIANLDSITAARKYVYDAIIAQCGIREYIKSKDYYDFYIEDYISSYIFKDYLDLNACSSYQLVLRVWEACGIPRYDPHIFPYPEHYWFLYNAGYPRSHYRAEHNLNFGFSLNADYSKFKAPKDINWRYPLIFCDPPLKAWFALVGLDDYHPAYAGAGAAELCDFNFYFPRLGLMSGTYYGDANVPGNTCSRMLWRDAMVNVLVDDKQVPLAEKPGDLFFYCDNASSLYGNQYEYAGCNDISTTGDNATDGTCHDGKGAPYNEIECIKENDGILTDALDATGQPFGWYGCTSHLVHEEENHDVSSPCEGSTGNWAPIYCRSWLCLDSSDQGGKINPLTLFYSPVFRSSLPDTNRAGKNKFWIWDNCEMDKNSLTQVDSSFQDNCGNGWFQRTWTAKDRCGNKVTTHQKIFTLHRSDFEVIFPRDRSVHCYNKADLLPITTGVPLISDDECELVAVTYTDEIFDIVPDACYKIIRTWHVKDWCKFQLTGLGGESGKSSTRQEIVVDNRLVADTILRPCVYRNVKDNGDGDMTYIQVIKVFDTVSPTVQVKDTTICILDSACAGRYIDIPLLAIDDCTSGDKLQFRWELDLQPSAVDLSSRQYSARSIDMRSGSDTRRFAATVPSGVSLIHIIASDRCGNEDTSAFTVTIKDCKRPTPYCFDGLATVIMPASGSITIWAKDLDAGSFDNCTASGLLSFSFSEDKELTNKIFTCKDIIGGRSANLKEKIFVWDTGGLYDYCLVQITIQDASGNYCPDSLKSNLDKAFNKTQNPIGFPLINTLPPQLTTNIRDDNNGYRLLQNYPNPFSLISAFGFMLPKNIRYQFTITDITGRTVWTQQGIGQKGLNQIVLHRSHLQREGIYYYTISTNEYAETKKMIFLN